MTRDTQYWPVYAGAAPTSQMQPGIIYQFNPRSQQWEAVGETAGADEYLDVDMAGNLITNSTPKPPGKGVPTWAIVAGAAGGLLIAVSIFSAVSRPRPNRRLAGCGCR